MLEVILWFAYREERVSLPSLFKDPAIVLKNHAVFCSIGALTFLFKVDMKELFNWELGSLTMFKFLGELICALWFTRFLVTRAQLQASCLANPKSETHSLVRYLDSRM